MHEREYTQRGLHTMKNTPAAEYIRKRVYTEGIIYVGDHVTRKVHTEETTHGRNYT